MDSHVLRIFSIGSHAYHRIKNIIVHVNNGRKIHIDPNPLKLGPKNPCTLIRVVRMTCCAKSHASRHSGNPVLINSRNHTAFLIY
ncbi:hypothetical protein D3C76_1734790 [compost metagenome]